MRQLGQQEPPAECPPWVPQWVCVAGGELPTEPPPGGVPPGEVVVTAGECDKRESAAYKAGKAEARENLIATVVISTAVSGLAGAALSYAMRR